MSKPNFTTPLLFSSLLCLSACSEVNWFAVETEVEEICAVDLTADFPAAPLSGSISHVFGGDELAIDLGDEFQTEIFLSGFGVTALSGIEDFTFVDRLVVQISTADIEPKKLLNFDSSNGTAGDSPNWYLAAESAINIADYMESDSMELAVEFAGSLPDTAWAADLKVCISAKAGYSQSLPF